MTESVFEFALRFVTESVWVFVLAFALRFVTESVWVF